MTAETDKTSSSRVRNRAFDQKRPLRADRRAVAAVLLTSLYVVCFFVQPPPSLEQPLRKVLIIPRAWVSGFVDRTCEMIGLEEPFSPWVRHAGYLVATSAVLPWLIMFLLRRGRPRDIGLRLPNALAWRLILVGYLAALPLQVWMVRSPGMGHYYGPQFRQAGAMVFLGYYFINMLSEHFFFHGIMLAAFRPGLRWPDPARLHRSVSNGVTSVTRCLQWLGFAQPTAGVRGFKRLTRWIGLPDGCLAAVLASGALFGAIHLSKDPRELFLSVPGGMAVAYLAYRTNSWLVPFTLHLITAGTALWMMSAAPSFR